MNADFSIKPGVDQLLFRVSLTMLLPVSLTLVTPDQVDWCKEGHCEDPQLVVLLLRVSLTL